MSRCMIAGHQPNFFPWFGYFEKMAKCDLFVFSDDVQFPKQCYVNRVTLPINGSPAYLTLPVIRGGDEQIATKCFQKDPAVLDKLLKTIRFNLGGLPHYGDLTEILTHFATCFHEETHLGGLNIRVLKHIAAALAIRTPVRTGLELGLQAWHRNERLVRRCQILQADRYLCGHGSDDYQDDAMLCAAGIEPVRIRYDIGQRVLGEDLPHSILLAIARHGLAKLVDALQDAQSGMEECQ